MGYEENNPSDIDTSKVLMLLSKIFPDLKTKDISFFYHGTYNVFIIKKEYIFRFPDKSLFNKRGFNLIQNEFRFLNEIRDSLSLSIPDPIFISEDENNPYVGYKKIPGVSLSRVFDKTSDKEKIKLGKSIGYFLTEYHSLDLLTKIRKRIYQNKIYTTNEHHQAWLDIYIQVKKIVFPRIGTKYKKWLERVFSDYLDTKQNFIFSPTLVHGDFDTSNILVNPENLEITGIIDFEEARISDPAVDLIFLDEGTIFRKSILDNYGGELDSSLDDRVKFYYCRAGTAYILYGIEWKIPKLAEYGKLMLKKRMQQFPYN